MSCDGSDHPPLRDHSDFPLMVLIPPEQVRDFESGHTREKLNEAGRVRLGDMSKGGKVLFLTTNSQRNRAKGLDLVMEALESAGNLREVSTFVPEDMVSPLIGTRGRQIAALQDLTHTNLRFEKKLEGLMEREVRVSGHSRDIRFAIEKLHSRVTERKSDESPIFAKFVIPLSSASHLIGKGGVFTKNLLQRYGVELKVGRDDSCDETKELAALLLGRKSGCLEALPEVVMKVEDAIFNSDAQKYSDKTTILVKTNRSEGTFNGLVREVKRESGVSLRVFESLKDEFRVEVTGELRERQRAVRMLLEGASRESPRRRSRSRSPVPFAINIIVPKTLVGRLIGKGGENVKMLKSRSGCHINFQQTDLKAVQTGDGKEARACTMTGSPTAIAMGVRCLWEQILKFETLS